MFFTSVTRNPYIIQNIIFRTLTFISLSLIFFSRKNGIFFAKTYLDRPLAIYGAVIFLSMLVPLVYYFDFRTAYFVFWGKRMMFFAFNCAAVFYISFLMSKNAFYRKVLIYSLLLTAAISSLYAILQYTGHEFIWPQNLHHYGTRSVSTFGNPNFLASFMIVILMLNLWLFLSAEKTYGAIISLILLAINFFALLITQTRSSWGGFGVAFIIFAVFALKKVNVRKIASVAALLIFITFIFPKLAYYKDHPTVLDRIIRTFHLSDVGEAASVNQRFLIWECALRMFRRSPVFGHGWGSFEIRYPVEQGIVLKNKAKFRGLRTHANNSHNEILEELSQIGIIGFAAFVFLWLTFFIKAIKAFFKTRSFLLLGCIAGIAGFFAGDMLNVTLHFPMPALAFWAAVGIGASESSAGPPGVFRRAGFLLPLKIAAALVFIVLVKGQIDYFKGEMYYFRGFGLSRQGNIEKAAAECKKSWQSYRWNVDNNYELGNCYMRQKMLHKAIWAYKEALKANPGYDEIYFNLAIAYQNAEVMEEAEKNFIRACEINPVSFEYFLSLGNFYLKNKKDFAKAEKYYGGALALNPDSADVLNNMGYLAMLANDSEKSFALYKRALEANPSYELARRNIVSILEKMNIPADKWHRQAAEFVNGSHYEKAIPLYEKILEYNPGDVQALFYLGNCCTSLKRFDDAVGIYERLVRYFPGEKNFPLNLARIYLLKGEKEKARRLAEETAKRFPESRDAAELLEKFQ
ncbi:MAG: tetratricopeptide repeat protein [bacterium]